MKIVLLGICLFASCYAAEDSIPADISALDLPNVEAHSLSLDERPSADFQALPMPPEVPLQLPLLATVPWQPTARKPVDTRALIRAASRKHGVSAAFIKSIVAAESNFDVLAVSDKGALGLMQVMPATALLFGDDAAIPEQNVDAGAHYLRILTDRYHKYRDWMKRVIAAYNAGPGAVDRYRGVPPYPETKTYVARVLSYLKQFQRQPV
jgi:soluble lytic murein transglycosylase-like protein